MEGNKTEFKKYLKILVTKLHEAKPTSNTEKILKVFDKLNIEKVSIRFYNSINPHYNLLDEKNKELFNQQLNVLPKVNLSDYWGLLDDESKNKLWSLLNVLYVLSDLIKSTKEEGNSLNNNVCEVDEKNKNYNLTHMLDYNQIMIIIVLIKCLEDQKIFLVKRKTLI